MSADSPLPAPALPYFPAPVIIEAVAAVFGIAVEALRGGIGGRGDLLGNTARNATAVLLKELTPMSNAEIARAMGRRDSTTARELLNAAAALDKKDPRFGQTIEQVRKRLAEGLHV